MKYGIRVEIEMSTQQQQQQQQQDVEMSSVVPPHEQQKPINSQLANVNKNVLNKSAGESGTQSITQSKDYHYLPTIDVQYDWQLYLQSESDCFWLTYRDQLNHSVHSSVRTTKLSKDNYKLETENNFTIESSAVTIDKYFNLQITSLGVSSEGSVVAYGSSDGILEIMETETGHVRRKLQGHAGDVDVAKFFPSGKVLLSGASDARLKIWDALEGNCATTLTGHTGGITSASFVERGRNLVSTSRDGSARLWDIPTASTIQTLHTSNRPVNDCFVYSSCNMSDDKDLVTFDEREFGTDGKLVLLALEDGSLLINDIRSNKIFSQVSSTNHKSAFNCCAVLGNQIYGGDEDGCIYQYDKRNLDKQLSIFQFCKSPIQQLKIDPNGSEKLLWCTAADGSVVAVDMSKQVIARSLSGIDTDIVTALDFSMNHAFTTTRDPFIRIYDF
ncbi:Putative WD40 repeat protein [Heterostelium album PN500]|uniref:WD40 repeat protein n=1 Tax=Heterostelium pallidum (strain ATCC 26659 / Pp 5 / PN500) TaxID=670386 RepID=D3BCF6_HETP5|nr:Putative WD40 repeat protein [Heterostelium album PN500]EFA80946.1 Putative WD40 repeat protein [Heterostelium album PN500]|eukprot:XP_020433064.1 Putative WD40 repeat protein [Heterostelium album PN500]